jgi:poly(A) polymerase
VKLAGEWLEAPGTQAVLTLLTDAGYEAFVVGGCVRNALLGRAVADIDISTSAEPQDVTRLAKAAGYKAVPTGIEHGTVTVVINGEPHEITTYRKDVETDGRRAVVVFSDDIHDDARRRDFTMNALYAAADGTLVDPLKGLADLENGRVRFIEDAETRIREDYLRILRFFRFHAWYGDAEAGPDTEALDACAKLADGLDRLSKERIGAEIRKLLDAPDPAPAVAMMAATGVLARVLPEADPSFLAPLVHFENESAIDARWQRRLRCLGSTDWTPHLRLSRAETREIGEIDRALIEGMSPAEAAYRFGAEVASDATLIRAATIGSPPPEAWENEVAKGLAATFPVRAADLLEYRSAGPELGEALNKLERAWINSGFRMDRQQLLAIDSKSAD